MSGGPGESPRQRMIGMMYLVLTALLALQVSNSVLDKFVFIDETLQSALHISSTSAKETVEGIAKAVEKSGNSAADLSVLSKAKKVQKLAAEMEANIEGIRTEIIKQNGGKDERGVYPKAKDYDQIMTYMLGVEGGKPGRAYDLHKELDTYLDDIRALDDSLAIMFKGEKLTKGPKEITAFAKDENQMNKNWEEFNFDHTPMVASLAVLSHMQTEIAAIETQALERLAAKVGATKIKFDKIKAMVTAESKVVAAGTKYKAKMFIAAGSSNGPAPRMNSSAGSVKVNAEGEGEIEFTASGGGYDKEGKVTKTWKGSITIPNGVGVDTTFDVTEEYTVVKPVIDIQSASVSALYFKCGNELNIQVPALGTAYNPSITASQASVIKGSKKGLVTIVPQNSKSTITVKSDGNLIGSRDFKVRLVPKPTIEIRKGKKPINLKTGGACPRSLSAVAVSDKSFKDMLPKDARYRVTGWEVSLARGRRLVGASKKVSGASVNLNDFASKAKPGDRLVIEVKSVQRMNFQKQTENIKMGSQIFTYPIQ